MACANVANLLLARGVGRRRELALRAALGASPGKLVAHVLAEALLLGLGGALLGLALAAVGTPLLLRLLPEDLPRAREVRVDAVVLSFTLAAGVLASLLFGALPALTARRLDLVETLKAGGRSLSGASRRLRRALVTLQLAVALVLLAGAGLLLRSLLHLLEVEPGFATSGVTVSVQLPRTRYPTPAEQACFYDQLVARLGASGRFRVGVGFPAPFGDGTGSNAPLQRADRPAEAAPPMTLFASVTPGYFGAMAIPLVAGRDFSADDSAREAPVVVVSRAAAERFWPGEDPIGSHVTLGSDKPLEVVGVVGDIRRKSLDAVPEPMVYVPLYMLPVPFSHLVLRGAEPAVLVSAARAAVLGLDAELLFGPADTLEDVRQRAAAQPRFRAFLLALFAALAVALAVVGL